MAHPFIAYVDTRYERARNPVPCRTIEARFTDVPSLVGTGSVDKAAIFNAEGTSVWATTPGFSVTPREMQQVVDSYRDTRDVKAVQGSGFHIAGDKFITLKADDRSLYGKKVRQGGLSTPSRRVNLPHCGTRGKDDSSLRRETSVPFYGTQLTTPCRDDEKMKKLTSVQ